MQGGRVFKNDIFYPDLSYRIVGLLFETHNKLDRYCKESQYADYIETLLKDQKIVYKREYFIPVSFKGEKVGRNVVDFIIDDKIILELKASRIITKKDYYQVQRYLLALNKDLAILVNFREKFIGPKRVIKASGRFA